MSENVQLPALGESVTEGTVTRWLKQVGDRIEVDEPLVEVSTDKVDTEIPSPVAGIVQQILVAEDETVAVGVTLAVVGDSAPAATTPATPAPAAPVTAPATPTPPTAATPTTPTPPPTAGGGTDVQLPALGESVTEGTVTRWLKQVGDRIEVDEPLVEVSTDKVDTEIPSPVAGIVQQILVAEDETVAVGVTLAVVGDSAPAATTPATPAPATPAPAAPVTAPATPTPPTAATPTTPTPPPTADTSAAAVGGYVTPLVRKLAADKGVDLSTVPGTGVGGRIRKEDVLDAASRAAQQTAAAAQPAPATPAPQTKSAPPAISPLRGTTEKQSRLRKLVAARMVEALQTQAQLTTVVEVDVTRVAKLRAQTKDEFRAREGVNLTFLPFFTLAAVEALKTYPKINASITETEIIYHGSENVGIAVDTERGLVVPVIQNAGDLNLAGISRKIADLAGRTRANKVGPDELAGGTFTITNTGSGGALIDTPIVPVGQVAILGTGTIVKRPVVVSDADGGESIAVRSMCYIFLSYDHRLVDGADAARFLTAVKNRIEEGAFEDQVGR